MNDQELVLFTFMVSVAGYILTAFIIGYTFHRFLEFQWEVDKKNKNKHLKNTWEYKFISFFKIELDSYEMVGLNSSIIGIFWPLSISYLIIRKLLSFISLYGDIIKKYTDPKSKYYQIEKASEFLVNHSNDKFDLKDAKKLVKKYKLWRLEPSELINFIKDDI